MVDAAPVYQLDWLAMAGNGVTDSQGVQWILMEETGFWDSPEPRSDQADRTNAHGAYIGPIYYGGRVITLKGRAYADTANRMRSAQSRVTALCADPHREYPLTCDSEIGKQTCQVRTDGPTLTTPVRVLNKSAFEFSVQVIAPDPRKYSTTWWEMRADLPSATTGDGLDFMATGGATLFSTTNYRGLDFDPALSFGASNSTGFLQLTNSGTAPTYPVYELHGPLTNPTLTATTDEHTAVMRYNALLAAGEHVVIDPSIPAVLLDGTASRRWLLNPADFYGFAVPANGMLRVGLSHEGATTTGGYATARFRAAYF